MEEDYQYKSRTSIRYLSNRQEREKFRNYEQAIQKDFEELLNEYVPLETLNFEAFAELWVAKQLSLIFVGCTKVNELAYITEICFNSAKKYILFTDSYHFQIGGFYMLYALYYKQPIKELIKIRLTLDDFKAIKKLILKMSEIKQNDAVYIYNKLKQDDAFHYTYTQYDLSPDIGLIKHELDKNILPKNPIMIEQIFLETNEDYLKKINNTSAEFDELFAAYKDDKQILLPKIPLTLEKDINKAISNFKNQCSEINLNDADYQEPGTSIDAVRRNIKRKAFIHRAVTDKGIH